MEDDKPQIKIGDKILKWVEPPPKFWAEGKFYSEEEFDRMIELAEVLDHRLPKKCPSSGR